MAKFLHEFNRYANGLVVDNGWWEIKNGKCYNLAGGYHDYVPSEDDEIREGTWESILHDTTRDDSQMTGWVAPDGTFYGCKPYAHSLCAEYVIGIEERDLEERGYVKVFENPARLRQHVAGMQRYTAARMDGHHINEAQRKILLDKGIMDFW